MSVVCIVISPFMALTGYMGAKRSSGLGKDIDQSQSSANLLAGDAILNYRTVISFAHDEKIVQDYLNLLIAPQKAVIKSSHITGVLYGMSQFMIYASMASLFYAGALILKEYGDAPIDMFICIFAMNFGALASGQANQFGPDVGKAKSAAGRIFSMIEHPTEITALHGNGKKNQVEIDLEKFQGNIEFHNVWFRYPTRKTDWILKGLNLKINTRETVALVGESGCGKSTIVSLILRLYDVDYGKITIDGVDVRDYNLRQMRHAMSLVMQEPILFNYSILENILYGDSDASNTQVHEAAKISNALEFIESQEIQSTDDTARGILEQFQLNEGELTHALGEQLFRHKVRELERLAKAEESRGIFAATYGDIDKRSKDK